MLTPPEKEKVALVTGVAGQDGIYLAQLLLAKGYIVHGLEHYGSAVNADRLAQIDLTPNSRFMLAAGDLTDAAGLKQIVRKIRPDEIYNLAAQSSVQVSFDKPEATFATNFQGPTNLIDAILALPSPKQTRLFQASSSEIFGGAHIAPVTEESQFNPQNPYAESKRQAHLQVVEARLLQGLHASNGILFNHESPLRGEAFVTRKISLAVAAIHLGKQERLILGNLDARRDWGHAREYVEAIWLMLQQEAADDYVVATGIGASAREFVVEAFAHVGIQIEWRGAGLDEVGVRAGDGRVLVSLSPQFYRPSAQDSPIGDPSKARKRLGWSAMITWKELCAEMVEADLKRLSEGPR